MRLCTFLLLCAAALPSFGQQLLKPQSIRFAGTQEYTDSELLPVVGIKKGSVYTTEFLNASAQKLMALGVFDKVAFKFDGVDLSYQLHDNPELYPIAVENLPIATGADLDATLRARIPLYHGKVPAEGQMLDDVRGALESMVSEAGIQAKVSFVPAGDNPGKKASSIKFRIDAPISVGDVTIQGASEELRAKLGQTVRFSAAKFDTNQTPISIANALNEFYMANGHPAARIVVQRSGNPVTIDGSIRVPFKVDIQEGPLYKLGTVELAPGIPASLAEIEKLLRARDTFKPESAYVAAVVHGLASRLKSKGYIDCRVSAHPLLDETSATVNYRIEATTGAQYHLGLLKFANVSDQLRALLMRSWQMMPGDPFDESYVSNFLLIAQKNDPILQRTLVNVKTTYDVQADPNTHDVNLLIRLER